MRMDPWTAAKSSLTATTMESTTDGIQSGEEDDLNRDGIPDRQCIAEVGFSDLVTLLSLHLQHCGW